MQFGIVQKERFSATDGSYSIVTAREVYDSQITATDAEAKLLKSFFSSRGENIFVGNVKSSQGAATKEFKLFPTGESVFLNLVYPKPEKSELRLYLSSRAGFKPEKGCVWFMFVDTNNNLWIGSLKEIEWRNENALYREEEMSVSVDGEVDINRNEIQPAFTTATAQYWKRSRQLAIKRMQLSKFKCEFDNTHSLFIARSTGCPFLESHHVIPIRFQPNFSPKKLDALNNLCCLCPTCHRAIHHAEESYARKILSTLAGRREIESKFDIEITDLYRLYAVEEITR